MDVEKVKEAKDREVLTKAVEKLVKLNQDQGAEITALKLRIKKIEDDYAELRTDVAINKSNTDIANFHANAEEDLYNFMMNEKDEDATDLPMTKADIQRGLQKYVERSGVKVIDDDE